jgi:chromosomal replication initiator protein
MTFSPKVWGDALRRLQDEIPDFVFDAWITPLEAKIVDDRLVLGCPTSFHRDRVRLNHIESIERCWRAAIEAAEGDREDTPSSPSANAAEAGSITVELLNKRDFEQISGQSIQAGVVRRTQLTMRKVEAGSAAIAVNGAGSTASLAQAAAGPSLRREPTGRQTGLDRVEPARALRPDFRSIPTPRSEKFAASVRNDSLPSSESRNGKLPTIQYSSPQTSPSVSSGTPSASTPFSRPDLEFGLDGAGRRNEPSFSFENFVVGPCNALAREAALALARRRQRSLNQLYLGGESGMGKTHLARAAAEEARRQAIGRQTQPSSFSGAAAPRDPRSASRVIHTSAEQFTSEFVSAMRNGRNEAWARRYRGPVDLLIVEDIHFLGGRTKTQLELFHTVSHVLDAGGRVLLTGDRAPHYLTELDARLRTQVGRGFVAELERPDPLVRRHILRAKAAAGGVHLPADCLDLLVEATGGSESPTSKTLPGESEASVRDLEGALIQVVTTASLLGRPIDLALTRDAIDLKSGASSSLAAPRLGVTDIVRIVASFFGKRPEALAARSRRRDVLVPRQLAMYLAHRYTEASLTEIGRSLGRDHPSVRNAIQRVERQVLEHAPIRYQVEALSERIDRDLAGPE